MQQFVLIDYIGWHYSRALKEGWHIWRNLFWFQLHFFGVPFHLRTFFSRFLKIGEPYPKTLEVFDLLGAFIVNSLMRIMGMVLRTVLILAGLGMLLLVFAAGLVFLVLWLLLPLAVLVLWVVGILLVIGV